MGIISFCGLSGKSALFTLTFHVIGLERVADVQHGRAEQHVRLQGLVAPHAERQLAEGSHDPAGSKQMGYMGHDSAVLRVCPLGIRLINHCLDTSNSVLSTIFPV